MQETEKHMSKKLHSVYSILGIYKLSRERKDWNDGKQGPVEEKYHYRLHFSPKLEVL